MFHGNTERFNHVRRQERKEKTLTQQLERPARYEEEERKEEHYNRLEELARLSRERARLDTEINAIASESSGPSLAQRLEAIPPTPLPLELRITQHSAHLQKINFRTKAKSKRDNDLKGLIAATGKRLHNLRRLFPDSTPPDIFARFFDLQQNWQERTRCFTNKNWRNLKRDCKDVGRLSTDIGDDLVRSELIASTLR